MPQVKGARGAYLGMLTDGYLIDSLVDRIEKVYKDHEGFFKAELARIKAVTDMTLDAWSFVEPPIEGLSGDDMYAIYCLMTEA